MIGDEQSGFRPYKGCMDHNKENFILNLFYCLNGLNEKTGFSYKHL